jgi:hypothetical protein
MTELIKIIVVDSGGEEHIFNVEDDSELYLEMQPEHYSGGPCKNCIRIRRRIFNGKKKFESETEAWFMNPRRFDLVYGEYE